MRLFLIFLIKQIKSSKIKNMIMPRHHTLSEAVDIIKNQKARVFITCKRAYSDCSIPKVFNRVNSEIKNCENFTLYYEIDDFKATAQIFLFDMKNTSSSEIVKLLRIIQAHSYDSSSDTHPILMTGLYFILYLVIALI